jgi:hypothetical protein
VVDGGELEPGDESFLRAILSRAAAPADVRAAGHVSSDGRVPDLLEKL